MNGGFIGGAIVKIEDKNGQQRTINTLLIDEISYAAGGSLADKNSSYYLLYITNNNTLGIIVLCTEKNNYAI